MERIFLRGVTSMQRVAKYAVMLKFVIVLLEHINLLHWQQMVLFVVWKKHRPVGKENILILIHPLYLY